MTREPSLEHRRRDPIVGRIADEFIERRRRGEDPQLAEYLEHAPEYAEAIREAVEMAVFLERLEASSVPAGQDEVAPAPREPEPGCLAELTDFHIIRELGRGGMGVVYEADQLSLGRRVALKVLPLGSGPVGRRVERFQNEIRACARLQHENIVSVYESGRSGGLCYYAMQLVRGQPLDQVLCEVRRVRDHAFALPVAVPGGEPVSGETEWLLGGRGGLEAGGAPPLSGQQGKALPGRGKATADLGSDLTRESSTTRIYYRSVARLGIQIAEALAYAHREGIIHRDIKPSNLLLDAGGKVWVTDFGLAKLEGSDLTHTGDVLGTLQYMAPERFRGWSDPRSDIYGLGATLYEMLVLRPPLVGADRGRLIELVAHSPPPPLRRLDPLVPCDLETIVLKTLEKEPQQRYRHAGELAADLRRFLEDRPIEARRSTVVEHAWRWLRRNRKVAALGIGLVLALSIGLAVSTLQWIRIGSLAEDQRRRLYNADMNAVQLAWEESNLARARALLARHRPTPAQQDLRGFEWRYLWRLCHGVEQVQTLPFALQSFRVSGDGRARPLGVGLGRDSRAQVWDGESGSVTPLDAVEVREPVLAPDGKRVAGIVGSSLGVWDAASGQVLETLGGPVRPAAGPLRRDRIAFSERGDLLVACGEDTVLVWKLGSAESPRRLEAPATRVVELSRDGCWLVTAGGDSVRKWETATGRLHGAFSPGFEVFYLALSPDARAAAIGASSQPLELRDLETGALIATLDHPGAKCLEFSPDGALLASGGWDNLVKLFELPGARQVANLRGHEQPVEHLAFSPDGSALHAVSGATLRTWMLPLGDGRDLYHCGDGQQTTALSFSADGGMLAVASHGGPGSPGGPVTVWDLSSGRRQQAIEWEAEPLTAACFAPGGALALGGRLGTLRLRDLANGQESAVTRFPRALLVLELTGDGRRLMASTWEATYIVDMPAARVLHQLLTGSCESADLSPDERAVAVVGKDGLLKVWDAASGRLRFDRSHPALGSVFGVAFSPDSRLLASAHFDTSVRIWDAKSGEPIGDPLWAHRGMAISVAFSPDGKTLASGGAMGDVKLWDAETFEEKLTLYSGGTNRRLAFSPDGCLLAAGFQHVRDVRIWRAAAIAEGAPAARP